MFFLDWVNWAANFLWPVLKVSEVISTIGDLNAFDTIGIRPLYHATAIASTSMSYTVFLL